MKNKIVVFILYIFGLVSFAQNDLQFSQANEAYNKGDYQKAIELYEATEKSGFVSANLYFNLANSYYKLQQVAPSIYNYEKALALAPNDTDIKTNYEFAKAMRIDAIDSLPKGFLSKVYEYFVAKSVDTWAWLSIIFTLLFVVCFVIFYRAGSSQQRKLFFTGWAVALGGSLLSLLFAFQTLSYKKNNKYAIVFADKVNIQSEPNLRSETSFKLHTGTKVKILESVSNWDKIELSDGKTGWIPVKEIKKL